MRRLLITSMFAAATTAALAGCMAEGYYEPDGEYAGRVYYYEPTFPDEVYFFEDGRPEFVDHRRVFHDRDRTYYVEKNRRVYYDHDAARSRRAPEPSRRR